jgi:hypothetical protein
MGLRGRDPASFPVPKQGLLVVGLGPDHSFALSGISCHLNRQILSSLTVPEMASPEDHRQHTSGCEAVSHIPSAPLVR